MAESATKLKMSPSVVRMLIDIDEHPGVRLGGGRIVVGSSRLDDWMSSKVADTSTLATPKSGQELIARVFEAKHHTVVLSPSVTGRVPTRGVRAVGFRRFSHQPELIDC